MRRSMLTTGLPPMEVGMPDYANAGRVGGSNAQIAFSTLNPATRAGTIKDVAARWFAQSGNVIMFVGSWDGTTFVVRSVSEQFAWVSGIRTLTSPMTIASGDYIGSWISAATPPDYLTTGYSANTRYHKGTQAAPTAGASISSWVSPGAGAHGFYGST